MLESRNRTSQGEKNNIDAVLLVSSDANPIVYEEIRKDTDMSHVLEELMKDVIDERVAQGIEQGIAQGVEQSKKELLTNMINNGGTVDVVAQLTGFSVAKDNSIVLGK